MSVGYLDTKIVYGRCLSIAIHTQMQQRHGQRYNLLSDLTKVVVAIIMVESWHLMW